MDILSLYIPYLHIHTSDFTSINNCNSSIRGSYGDSINDLNESFGKITSFIDNDNDPLMSNNSLIIFFTSDNGPWLNQSIAGGSSSLFYKGKWVNWEGGIRMIAFVY